MTDLEDFTDPLTVIGKTDYPDHFANRVITATGIHRRRVPGRSFLYRHQVLPLTPMLTSSRLHQAARDARVKAVVTCLDVPQPAMSDLPTRKTTAGGVTYEGMCVTAVATTDPGWPRAANAIKVAPTPTSWLTWTSPSRTARAAAVSGTTPDYRTTTAIDEPSTPPATGPTDVDAAVKTARRDPCR